MDFDPEKYIRHYPGSPKGPLPADDPKHYSQWFMRNQPTEILFPDG